MDRLCASVPTLGVPVLSALVSRYVLDVNRAPDDVDRDVCPALDRPTRVSARGLVWRVTTDGAADDLRPERKLLVPMPGHGVAPSPFQWPAICE